MSSFMESLSPEDKQYIEKHANPGESYGEAAKRLLSNKKKNSVLAPEKHKQTDFFIADIMDAAPKDNTTTMEHPFFALRTGDTKVRHYERNGNTVTIKPGSDGIATIHDKDIWIYCISQLVEAMNRGRPVSETVHFTAYDFLIATNRSTSGNSYKLIGDSLSRLRNTSIETNIQSKGMQERSGFGLIESWKVLEKGENDKILTISVVLPQWLFRSIEEKHVLTLSKDYFRIRKPLDRRMYEIARKHCGNQGKWLVKLSTLFHKSGSQTDLRRFRAAIKQLAKQNDLPDYLVNYDTEGDTVTFRKRAIKKR